MFEGPREVEMLRSDHVSLIPVAWRSEAGKDRNGYFTDIVFVKDHSKKANSIPCTGDKYRFKLRVKSGSFSQTSRHFYLTRCINRQSNGHFTVEIEYEGEGTQS